ncbi:unnamed protein product, partial [Rhizoctonia solani]
MDTFDQQPLFKGGFGDVYRGSLKGSLQIAVKTPRSFLDVLNENSENIKIVSREIRTWSKCNHPNVLALLGLVEFRGKFGMIAPWMENGNLPDYLDKNPSANRCKLCAEVCEGVAYLHSIGIVHGDLKGNNILVSSAGEAIVGDFGGSLSKGHSQKIVSLEGGTCITYRWAAPELLDDGGSQDQSKDENGTTGGCVEKTKESDTYALGMTILEVITSRPPWYQIQRETAVLLAVCSGRLHERPNEIPCNSRDGNDLWDLLVSCWETEPNKRPTAEDVGDV